MKFRKKPVVVEAVQWLASRASWDEIMAMGDVKWKPGDLGGDWFSIETLEGDMRVGKGDWVIKGVKGGCYPCRNDIFEATYNPVDGETENEAAFFPPLNDDGVEMPVVPEERKCRCGGVMSLWASDTKEYRGEDGYLMWRLRIRMRCGQCGDIPTYRIAGRVVRRDGGENGVDGAALKGDVAGVTKAFSGCAGDFVKCVPFPEPEHEHEIELELQELKERVSTLSDRLNRALRQLQL